MTGFAEISFKVAATPKCSVVGNNELRLGNLERGRRNTSCIVCVLKTFVDELIVIGDGSHHTCDDLLMIGPPGERETAIYETVHLSSPQSEYLESLREPRLTH